MTLITILINIFLLITYCYANTTKIDEQSNSNLIISNNPSSCEEVVLARYEHKNVAEQLNEWNKVYRSGIHYNDNHFEGAFEIIKTGFARAYYHLEFLPNYENHKNSAKLVLDDFFQQVCNLDKAKAIGGEAIYDINYKLAELITNMNNGASIEKINITPLPEGNRGMIDGFLPTIIYSNPNYKGARTAIGEGTLVDQFMHPSGSRWIYQLEPNYESILKLSKEGKSNRYTKKLPHGGRHNTAYFFSHDRIAHAIDAQNIIKNPIRMTFFVRANAIRKILLNKEDKNDYLILTKAMFYLFHEYKGYTGDYLKDAIINPKRQLMLKTKLYRDYREYGYKMEQRDHENILVTRNAKTKEKISLRDKNNVPFLRDEKNNDLLAKGLDNKTSFSKLSPIDKNVAVRTAYQGFWECVKQILDENDFNWENPSDKM